MIKTNSSIYVVRFLFQIIYNKTQYKFSEIEIIVYIETSFTISFGGPRWWETIKTGAFFPIE